MNFFYRFEGLDLSPGNKTAGFVMLLAPEALLKLARTPLTRAQQDEINEDARQRLLRAGLVSKRALPSSGIVFYEQTACARYFKTDPMFGASIGCDPVNFSKAQAPDALERLGSVVEYTPHNTDTAKQAMALWVLAQTWTEWAALRL